MRLPLDSHWREHICGLPETGMGYHLVDITLLNGKRVQNIPVFNAQEIEWPAAQGRIRTDDIVQITTAAR